MSRRLLGAARIIIVTMLVVSNYGCGESTSSSKPGSIALSPKLQKLFAKSKPLCFGRYVLSVPEEAKLIWGGASFPSEIVQVKGNFDEAKAMAALNLARLEGADKTLELVLNGPGPVPSSWQIRYYEGDSAKQFHLLTFVTYVNKEDWVFVLRGSTTSKVDEKAVAAQQAARAAGIRPRARDELPTEPGACLEQAFLADSAYRDQEMINVGLFLPSLPDVTFSISSNKDAYGDYPKEEFERMKKEELSLLARISAAQKEQGIGYPRRTVLREGKRAVMHWDGEE